MFAAIKLQYTNNFSEITKEIVKNRKNVIYVKEIKEYERELKNSEYKYIIKEEHKSNTSIN